MFACDQVLYSFIYIFLVSYCLLILLCLLNYTRIVVKAKGKEKNIYIIKNDELSLTGILPCFAFLLFGSSIHPRRYIYSYSNDMFAQQRLDWPLSILFDNGIVSSIVEKMLSYYRGWNDISTFTAYRYRFDFKCHSINVGEAQYLQIDSFLFFSWQY